MFRRLMASGLTALVLAAPGLASAEYPERAIRLIVPYAAGGGTDVAARMLAQRLTPRLGQPVVVENRPGGATQIGTQQVVRADPDGYTLLMGTANLATNTVLYKTLPYEVSRDLVPVIWATEVPVYVFVPGGSDVKDVAALVAAGAKGEMAYATPGQGSIPHLAGEMFARQAKVRLMHVPFKGSSEAVTALAGNQVPLSFDNLAPVLGQVKAGRAVPIAIAAEERNPLLPDVPTLTELGHPVVAASWWGVMAPTGTPPAVLERLNTELSAVLADPEVKQYLAEQGMVAKGGTPAEFAEHITEETGRWQAVVDEAGIEVAP